MGHSDLTTTIIYLHVRKGGRLGVISPADLQPPPRQVNAGSDHHCSKGPQMLEGGSGSDECFCYAETVHGKG